MRHVISCLLVAGCASSTALGFQPPSGGAAAGKACALLTRDLAMKVSTAAGRKVLEWAKPRDNPEGMTVAKGASACFYGRILLVLDPFGRPEQVRKDMRTPIPLYKDHERVSGVGDDAFFHSNSSFANLDVWTDSRHFSIQMGTGLEDDAKALKPNIIELAKAIVPQLR